MPLRGYIQREKGNKNYSISILFVSPVIYRQGRRPFPRKKRAQKPRRTQRNQQESLRAFLKLRNKVIIAQISADELAGTKAKTRGTSVPAFTSAHTHARERAHAYARTQRERAKGGVRVSDKE